MPEPEPVRCEHETHAVATGRRLGGIAAAPQSPGDRDLIDVVISLDDNLSQP